MRNLMTVLLAGALFAPAALIAQPPGPRARPDAQRMQNRGPRMGPQGPGAAQSVFSPQMLLQRRERLNLTDEQVTQLEALATANREAREKAATDARPRADKIRELWQADQPDAKAIESEMRTLMEAQHAAGIVAMTGVVKAKGLLTAEQRGRVEGWADARGMASRGYDRGPRGNDGPRHGAGYRMQRPMRWR
ncbi:MAG: Spy/CpxP family protein refolding chaperone [Gemmatimonadota bacterium]|nr:Spy/CpxP family protein refolding chaperone [Gemmatimonadota bacterium]MDH4349882.1 Spy/CpxP family protein refolding chaperone [Gemmatimonadota bacterium]MDH5196991.1 Spy/CpxP family protein refolding chaperone [Gemmatimonadota bacterium]